MQPLAELASGMAKLIRVPSVSAPSVQEEDSETEDEQKPILGSGESGRTKGVKRQDSVVDVVRHMKHPSTWNWRNLVVLATLWLAYCFVGGAYSVIGPFFPNEVGLRWHLPLCTYQWYAPPRSWGLGGGRVGICHISVAKSAPLGLEQHVKSLTNR